MNIILGSQSPRRRELLTGLDLPHTDVTIDADESYPADLVSGDIPKYISRAKAEAYTRTHELASDDLLITSDTIVWLDGKVLGKPHTPDEARQMLRSLSGKTHQVFTAVTFARTQQSAISNLRFPSKPNSIAATSPSTPSPRRRLTTMSRATALSTKPARTVSRSGSGWLPSAASMARTSPSWASTPTSCTVT